MKAIKVYSIIIFSVLNVLFCATSLCEGSTLSFMEKAESESTNHSNLEYGLTSLVIWPILLLLLGILILPTTLVIVVAFVIPIIVPYEGGGERSWSWSGRLLSTLSTNYLNNNTIWMPIYLAQEVLKGSESECIERISCEITKATRKSGYPLANWLHKQLRNSTAGMLSSNLQSRLSRSMELSESDQSGSSCFQFSCLPLGGKPREDSTVNADAGADDMGRETWRRSLDFSQMNDSSSLWDWFVKYWGGRYIFVRKLAANKDADFFPYRQ